MATNDITNDRLVTKAATAAYRDGWDLIYNKKPPPTEEATQVKPKQDEEET